MDFAIHSGSGTAIRKLQGIVGTTPDGVLGPKTLQALAERDARYVGNLLVGERVKLLGRICVNDPTQLVWLNGWINRAVSFLR